MRVYVIYNEQLARDNNIKVIKANDSYTAIEEARAQLEAEHGLNSDKIRILKCIDIGINFNANEIQINKPNNASNVLRVYVIYNEYLARDNNIKVIKANDSDTAIKEVIAHLEDEYISCMDMIRILHCKDTGIEIND